jgi:hypothetical protein
MLQRTVFLVALSFCSSFVLLTTGTLNFVRAGQNAADAMPQQAPERISGKVTDVLEAAGYTYAEVDTGKEKVWAAATTTPLKVGDTVAFTTEMPMKNFHSSAMNRDFPVIYFVKGFITDQAKATDAAPSMAAPHAKIKPAADATPIEGIDKVEGGKTIAEVHTDKQKLAGKDIRVRGQVTKFTGNVMGKNWLHIKDSSTADDLTVTTDSPAAIGDVVVIEGKLGLDKDFGYGYVYPLIVEDARVTAE